MAVAQALSPTIFILEDDPDIAGLLKHHCSLRGMAFPGFRPAADSWTKCTRAVRRW